MAGPKLTAGQLDQVKDVILDVLSKPLPVPQSTEPSDVPTQVDTDPIMAVVDQKIASIIDSLPTGNIILRGKRGSQMINQSEESLNTIADLLKDRKNYRTRNNIR